MSGQRHASSPARPRPVPISSPHQSSRGRSPAAEPTSRATSIARLALSPAASIGPFAAPPVRQVATPNESKSESQTPLAGADAPNSLPGPGHSALAAALQGSFGRSPPRFGTPPRFETPPLQPSTPATAGVALLGSGHQSGYGSFDTRSVQGASGWASPAPNENPEVVKRHLVQPSNTESGEDSAANTSFSLQNQHSVTSIHDARDTINATGLGDDEFSSLQLQGGDITRQVYRWTEEAESQSRGGRGKRSQSYHISRPQPEDDVLNINSIKVPGGFRRNYLRRRAPGPSRTRRNANGFGEEDQQRHQPRLFTKNFIEFLTLYGHFAGEELEDDDENFGPDEFFSPDAYEDEGLTGSHDGSEDDGRSGEDSALLTPGTPGRRKRQVKERSATGTNTPTGAALLLLKSFVGTGVLFLPKAYLNGGMLFSNVVLLGVAALSYHCFILLVKTRLKVEGSFGDMGGILYGKYMRFLILSSVALSQVGFVSAYIVFTSENLQAFILAVSKCSTWIDIKFMILMQLIVFLPLSLIRDISKLGFTAFVADIFILLGLIYLYYYDTVTIISNHGVSDIVNFNPRDWTLFIGTAIFTFEGVGLIIPIQESMKHPSKFPAVLAGVMIVITFIFITMGAMCYSAFGSATKTVVLLNLPQDNKFVNAVQFLYSLAILLSTPLQLFPAIRIMENEIFTRSGKYNPYIKWKKNAFRFFLVMVCALIAWGGAGDLDKFVAVVGSFACVPLVYVYPPLLHLKAVAQTRRQRVGDVVLCVFGAVVMIYTTALTVMSWAGGSSVKEPGYCDR